MDVLELEVLLNVLFSALLYMHMIVELYHCGQANRVYGCGE